MYTRLFLSYKAAKRNHNLQPHAPLKLMSSLSSGVGFEYFPKIRLNIGVFSYVTHTYVLSQLVTKYVYPILLR